ncbi:hypothetical protein BBJ29_005204 [Phytophthora kernoviae]|uniref:Uncharacterized protein n=1 Tax=Phytophthora kernoviae TaxID=325452 RepID=A0A3F2RR31_9STRA|nr:hypothetical protein BBP00_00004692 [Phytophthora kernoviae]RLN70500.1 hypothetical protein BBJ29_005204 [Phytophthora kernoviae]
MLRRAIQRARLHLPAPIGHDNGLGASPSDDEECTWSPSVSYTSLKDDDAVRDHFRTLPEDVTNGFTADMFEALGNKVYNDMIEAGEQSQISPAALEILGNCLYAEAETLAVSAAA